MPKRSALQFKITLQEVAPRPWRRIQISDLCTFWDLHVAIQDAMGWLDSHLHEFTVKNPMTGKEEYLGIDGFDEDIELHPVIPDWEVKVSDYLVDPKNKIMRYEYDFGDGWEHRLEFEGLQEKQFEKYPVCLEGQRACPPEDIGGAHGYHRFLEILEDPDHEEHQEWLEWVGGSFDPTRFDFKRVKFDDPKKRLQRIFEKA
jgi:hypothetical protein